jgi:hypothetical protein
MLVTEEGIVTLVRALQALKAELPILVIEFGIITLVSPMHPEKVELSILVTATACCQQQV